MRLAGFAMLVAVLAGSASAQVSPQPTRSMPDVTKNAEESVRLAVDEVGKDMNRDIRGLQGDLQSEAEKDARADRAVADKSKNAALAAKSAKLKLDNASITGGMNESKDKADKAMTSASVGLQVGIASGVQGAGVTAQTGAAPAGQTQRANDKVKTPAVKPCKDCITPAKPH